MTTPNTLYHCAPRSYLNSILVEGLSPEKSQSSLRAVFLSDCQGLASGYAGQRPELEHVLLAIEFTALDPELLGADNCELQDWLDDQDDDDSELDGVTHWSEASWQQSLKWCNQVAYYGVVPPAAIRVIEDHAPVQIQCQSMGV